MRRRRFLASVALTAGVTGCTRETSPGSDTPQPSSPTPPDESPTPTTAQSVTGTATPSSTADRTPTSQPTPTTIPETSVVVSPAYRHRFYADAFRVVQPDRAQFAFVQVPHASEGEPPSAFELVVGEGRFDPDVPAGGPPLMPGVETLYTAAEPSGWLAFDVPLVGADHASILGPERQYTFPQKDVPDFATAPEFVVESVSAPDRVGVGDPIELTVEVRNDGDRDGVFLAGFQHSGLPELLTLEIDSGETEVGVASYEAYQTARMQFAFRHAHGGGQYEIVVEGTDTPDGTDTA